MKTTKKPASVSPRSVRRLAERLSDAYFADIATGNAPGITLADLIETNVLDFIRAAESRKEAKR